MTVRIESSHAPRANRLSPAVWGLAAGLLLLPLVAMQFTSEVAWELEDFIAMGAMLFAACGAYELATRLSGNTAYRAGAGVAVVTAFLTVWVNLAAGMIGSENNPANLVFGGVIGVAIVGAVIARFRPRGMAVAMAAAAVAQALAAVLALVLDGPLVFFLTACFAGPWLVSAALFYWAARQQVPAR